MIKSVQGVDLHLLLVSGECCQGQYLFLYLFFEVTLVFALVQYNKNERMILYFFFTYVVGLGVGGCGVGGWFGCEGRGLWRWLGWWPDDWLSSF